MQCLRRQRTIIMGLTTTLSSSSVPTPYRPCRSVFGSGRSQPSCTEMCTTERNRSKTATDRTEPSNPWSVLSKMKIFRKRFRLVSVCLMTSMAYEHTLVSTTRQCGSGPLSSATMAGAWLRLVSPRPPSKGLIGLSSRRGLYTRLVRGLRACRGLSK